MNRKKIHADTRYCVKVLELATDLLAVAGYSPSLGIAVLNLRQAFI